MFVIQVEPPTSYTEDDRYTSCKLDADELAEIGTGLNSPVMFIAYWYATGSYEGAGFVLYSTDGMLWYSADMGHCSCNGPTDGVQYHREARTLEDLEKSCTEEALRDVKPLIDVIRSHHWDL